MDITDPGVAANSRSNASLVDIMDVDAYSAESINTVAATMGDSPTSTTSITSDYANSTAQGNDNDNDGNRHGPKAGGSAAASPKEPKPVEMLPVEVWAIIALMLPDVTLQDLSHIHPVFAALQNDEVVLHGFHRRSAALLSEKLTVRPNVGQVPLRGVNSSAVNRGEYFLGPEHLRHIAMQLWLERWMRRTSLERLLRNRPQWDTVQERFAMTLTDTDFYPVPDSLRDSVIDIYSPVSDDLYEQQQQQHQQPHRSTPTGNGKRARTESRGSTTGNWGSGGTNPSSSPPRAPEPHQTFAYLKSALESVSQSPYDAPRTNLFVNTEPVQTGQQSGTTNTVISSSSFPPSATSTILPDKKKRRPSRPRTLSNPSPPSPRAASPVSGRPSLTVTDADNLNNTVGDVDDMEINESLPARSSSPIESPIPELARRPTNAFTSPRVAHPVASSNHGSDSNSKASTEKLIPMNGGSTVQRMLNVYEVELERMVANMKSDVGEMLLLTDSESTRAAANAAAAAAVAAVFTVADTKANKEEDGEEAEKEIEGLSSLEDKEEPNYHLRALQTSRQPGLASSEYSFARRACHKRGISSSGSSIVNEPGTLHPQPQFAQQHLQQNSSSSDESEGRTPTVSEVARAIADADAADRNKYSKLSNKSSKSTNNNANSSSGSNHGGRWTPRLLRVLRLQLDRYLRLRPTIEDVGETRKLMTIDASMICPGIRDKLDFYEKNKDETASSAVLQPQSLPHSQSHSPLMSPASHNRAASNSVPLRRSTVHSSVS